MSSCGNPVVEGEALMPRKKRFDKSKTCIKCKALRANIVVRHAVYCKDCFFAMVTVKFRRALDPHVNATPDGTRRVELKASGNLLVGFSGGLGSTILLDILSKFYYPRTPPQELTAQSKKDPKNKFVWGETFVCYVDTCNAFPGSRSRFSEVQEAVARYPYCQFLPLKLEDCFDRHWWARVTGCSEDEGLQTYFNREDLSLSTTSLADCDNPTARLQQYLSSLPSPTAVRSSLSTLIRTLLLYTARETMSSHLLLGTSLTSLSVSLLTSIAHGGGFNIREEVYEEWRGSDSSPDSSTPSAPVRIVRPMKDIGAKECAAWAWWHDLDVYEEQVSSPNLKQTIGGLIRNFIVGLERDYPSTISTITRTCEKVAPKEEGHGICVICERPSPRGTLAWKDHISVRALKANDRSDLPATTANLSPSLCYACHTALTSRSSRSARSSASESPFVPLPTWTSSRYHGAVAAERLLSRDHMKAVLNAYLIDEVEDDK